MAGTMCCFPGGCIRNWYADVLCCEVMSLLLQCAVSCDMSVLMVNGGV